MRPALGANRRLVRLAALALGLSLAVQAALPAPAASAPEAEAKVDRFHAALIAAMQAGGFGERMALLEPAVAEFFDVATVARISVGASWRGLSEERRAAFVELLERLILATYADRFDSYSGQRFVRLEVATASTGTVVKSQIQRASGEPVNLDYYFRGERVFNVVADGVSDLSLRRADYASIIRGQGFDALVEHVQADIAELGAGPPG